MPAVVPDRPVGRLVVDLVEGPYARAEVLDQRAAVGLAVDLDLTQREARLDRIAARDAQSALAQLRELLGERQAASRREVARAQLHLLAHGHTHHVVGVRAAGKGDAHRRVEAHTHGHALRTAVGEHDLLCEPLVREAEGDLALEGVREVAVDGVVARIGVVAALDEHLVVVLCRLRHGERLALEDAVVVVVLLLDGDGVLVGAPLEGVASVRNAVGREEHRQAEDLRTSLEGLDLVGRRRAQDLDAQPRIGQPHEVRTYRGHEQRRVVALRKFDGLQAVPVDAADHPTAVFRSSPSARPSMRRRPACRPARRP